MLKHVLSQTQLRDKVVNMIIESGQARLPTLPLRKASLVSAPTPLLRLRDFHSIDSAQKVSVPSLQEVAETFVCAPMTRPERQWPLPKDRHCPQTFLFGQSGIRGCCLTASSSDAIYDGSNASCVKRPARHSSASR